MIHAYHSKKGVSFAKEARDVVTVHGLPLNCILIDGEFFFDVLGYLTLFDVSSTGKNKGEHAARLYRSWREGTLRKGIDGIVVATTRKYYSNIAYLTEITRDLELVKDNGTLFTTTTRLEHEEGVIAIYRGIATPPDCVRDSKSGYTWDDFFEVKHSTLLSTPHRSGWDADHKLKFNVPIVTVSGGIVKPTTAEDMPEVIKVNHPINKDDVRKETLLIPKNTMPATEAVLEAGTATEETNNAEEVDEAKEPSSTRSDEPMINPSDIITGLGALVGQLVGGKKIKLTVTLELE